MIRDATHCAPTELRKRCRGPLAINIWPRCGQAPVAIYSANFRDATLDDDDWACDAAFSSGEALFELPHSIVGADWQKGQQAAKRLVKNYLAQGKQAERLKASRAISVGFVAGDIEIVYLRKDA